MLGYRSQIHKSLGFSPFFMMFGRAPRLPIDADIDASHAVRSKSAAAYIDELCEGLRTVYREAIQISDARHQLNKRLYERKLNSFHYSVGDRVLLFRGVAGRGEYHKFLRPWKPAVIVAKRGELNYRVRTDNGKMLCIHHNRLKPNTVPSPKVTSSGPVNDCSDVNVTPDVTNVTPPIHPSLTPVGEGEGCRLRTRFRPVPTPRRAASSAPLVPEPGVSAPPGPETVSPPTDGAVGESVTVADSVVLDSGQLTLDSVRRDGLSHRLEPSVEPRRSERERRPPDRYGFSNI